MSKRVLIISGEESGDKHGASLIEALKVALPGIELRGMGGARMRRAGLDGIDSAEVSVVGIVEVISRIPAILRTFNALKSTLRGERFDAVILIDLPDFNLRMAKVAKKIGIPVIYYISPQVWAWRRGRVKKIAKVVDKMLVVFPFEVELYKGVGLDVEYVGHPLLDSLDTSMDPVRTRMALGCDPESIVIGLLPGSRREEVHRLLPIMLEAGVIISKKAGTHVRYLIPKAANIAGEEVEKMLNGSSLDIKVLDGEMDKVLRASHGAVVASGTATLEAAIMGTPMVIVYKLSPLTYALGRLLIKVDHVGLPNIVARREVVAELIQDEANPVAIATEVLGLLKAPRRRERMMEGYGEIMEELSCGDVSGEDLAGEDPAASAVPKRRSGPQRAAESIRAFLESRG